MISREYAEVELGAARRRLRKSRTASTEEEERRNATLALIHYVALDDILTAGGELPKEWNR